MDDAPLVEGYEGAGFVSGSRLLLTRRAADAEPTL